MTVLRFSFGWFKMADVVFCSTTMPPAKRRRGTVIASRAGIDRAEKALLRMGFGSKSNFAKAQLMGKSTIDRFFNRHPIQLDSFKRICDGLNIEDWRSIAELEPLVEQCGLADSEKVAGLASPATAIQPDHPTIPFPSIESQTRLIRQTRTMNMSAPVFLELFSEPAAIWLRDNSKQLAIEACEAVLGQDPIKTDRERKDFQYRICYYLRLVERTLIALDSRVYYRKGMKNFLGLSDIYLYIKAFKQIRGNVRRNASRELSSESINELEFRINDLIKYLEGLAS